MSYDKLKSESYNLLGGINTKQSAYTNEIFEFRDLKNVHFPITGALSKRPGTNLYLGATVQGRITGLVEFEKLNGASYIVATANTNAYTVTSSYNAFRANLLNNALFDFSIFVDRMFAANGQDFFKFDGTNAYNYGLPDGQGAWGVTVGVGGGLSGIYQASYGYLNERGYFGPVADGVTISLNGITFGSIIYYGLTLPAGYGITAMALYRSSAGGVDLTGTTLASVGATTVTDTGFPLTSRLAPDTFWFTLAPRYLEIYNNQLFMAGFSTIPSTVVWSQIGEPEGIEPEFNAEFRTNDGDIITGLQAYQSYLIVTKTRSTHRVGGDNPSNFFFTQISDQYGCLSGRALVVYDNFLWFLDPKGIVEYNGANIKVVSTKVESIFQRMNINAAKDNAVMIHVREYNEIWCSIPVDGSTENNLIVVYDYVAQAWTTYEGVKISSICVGQGALVKRNPIAGGYTGSIFNFDTEITSDLGQAVTCTIQTSYVVTLGETYEKQYRRFYLNVEPYYGATVPINIDFRSNYQSTIVLTDVIYQQPFQTRLDFGIPARAVQATIKQSSATAPFLVYGFTFESRFQRAV